MDAAEFEGGGGALDRHSEAALIRIASAWIISLATFV